MAEPNLINVDQFFLDAWKDSCENKVSTRRSPLMGTIRRECLDYVIPLSEKHLRTILREWVRHYNQGRPHASWDQAFRIPTAGRGRVQASIVMSCQAIAG